MPPSPPRMSSTCVSKLNIQRLSHTRSVPPSLAIYRCEAYRSRCTHSTLKTQDTHTHTHARHKTHTHTHTHTHAHAHTTARLFPPPSPSPRLLRPMPIMHILTTAYTCPRSTLCPRFTVALPVASCCTAGCIPLAVALLCPLPRIHPRFALHIYLPQIYPPASRRERTVTPRRLARGRRDVRGRGGFAQGI